VFCLCSCCPLHLLRRYSYTPTYPTVLTIVHLDGTSILSLYSIQGLSVLGLKRRQERYRVALHVQCVTLLDAGIPLDVICSRWLVTKSVVHRWKRIAKSHGYNPEVDPRLLCSHVENTACSGCPSLQTYKRTQQMIKEVYNNKEGCNLNCRKLGGRFGVLGATAYWMLKKNGFRNVKESTKPGLTEVMKKARLKFCKDYEHWTLEDWKRVIWTDETSVVLGYRRGQYRIWQRDFERHAKTCVRSRFKKASEFMFWGCFSWDYRGPYHIWAKETKA
jgi:hypothetical protein